MITSCRAGTGNCPAYFSYEEVYVGCWDAAVVTDIYMPFNPSSDVYYQYYYAYKDNDFNESINVGMMWLV